MIVCSGIQINHRMRLLHSKHKSFSFECVHTIPLSATHALEIRGINAHKTKRALHIICQSGLIAKKKSTFDPVDMMCKLKYEFELSIIKERPTKC